MLLRFGLQNFLSLKNYQEINLTATSLRDESVDLIHSKAISEHVLPAAVIYGPNASGKSNFLRGLDYLKILILNSHTRLKPEDKLNVKPFDLDESATRSPTSFDVDFVLDETRFHFGLVLDNSQVIEEWLYSYGTGKRRSRKVLYHRNSEESPRFYFGPSLKGRNVAISELTRPNSLFLSAAAQNNHEQLTRVREFFSRKLRFHQTSDFPADGTRFEKILSDPRRKAQLVSLLKSADLGVIQIDVRDRKRDAEDEKFVSELTNLINRHIESEIPFEVSKEDKELSLLHTTREAKPKPLPILSESRGTLALLNLLVPILNSLSEGKTLIIDELDTSLHPRVTRELVSLFNSVTSNQKGAQLVFTTHDTTLLTTELFRRDQIWFTEKNSYGESEIFSLADFKVRTSDNLEKGYLEGRFGGVPKVIDFASAI